MQVSNEHIVNFLLGGKCECIIRNTQTKNIFKFNIKSNTEDRGGNMYFVYTDKGGKKVYAGFISSTKGNYSYKRGNKGLLTEDDLEIKALMYVLRNPLKLPTNVEILHVGKCARCGRKLTNPESIHMGLGPECIKKVNVKIGA